MHIGKRAVFIVCLTFFSFFITTDFSVAHAFSEQRKFIGQEYDAVTQLDYLNARYYDAKRGQFINQDSLVRNNPEQFLADPQQLNDYSYARNNPINASDPSGQLTIIIPGTGYNSKDWSSSGSMANFISSVGKTFNDTKNTQVINNKDVWSGADNNVARQSAANSISSVINDYSFANGEPLNIVGHSHGGNVGILISQMTNHKIDNLVTLGTPVRSDYQPNYTMIKNHINEYSNNDQVYQPLGGGQFATTGIIGGLIGSLFSPLTALAGIIMGNKLGWGEFGSAGRMFDGAQNIEFTSKNYSGPFSAHGSFLKDPAAWSAITK